MACITPPALTDEQLLAFIDGAAADDVTIHLQKCASCRNRANQWARRQKQMAIQLYRVACPPPLELGEYHLDLLAPKLVLAVEKHLAECLFCAREVQALQGYLLDLAPTLEVAPAPEPVGELLGQRLRVVVAKLVDAMAGLSVGGLIPTFAAQRGEHNQHFVYEAGALQVIVELQAEPNQPNRKALLGLILGLPVGQIVEAHLQQAKQAPLTTTVDEMGNFAFNNLAPGPYTLHLYNAENEIRIEDLSV